MWHSRKSHTGKPSKLHVIGARDIAENNLAKGGAYEIIIPVDEVA